MMWAFGNERFIKGHELANFYLYLLSAQNTDFPKYCKIFIRDPGEMPPAM